MRRRHSAEVTFFEPGRRFNIRMLDGPPVDGRWVLEPIGTGTRLTMIPTVRLSGALRHAETLVAFATTLAFARFHRRLRRALEAT